MPLSLFMVHRFFHGVDNEVQLASLSYPALPYSLRVISIPGLGSCHFAAVGIQPAQSQLVPWERHRVLPQEPWSEPPPQTQTHAKVRVEGQNPSWARRSPVVHGWVEAAHLWSSCRMCRGRRANSQVNPAQQHPLCPAPTPAAAPTPRPAPQPCS